VTASPTPARRPRRDGLENRIAILAAAQQVISRDPNASIDAIAHAAGLSRRALYGHFPDREALLTEVIALGAGRFNAIAEAVGDPDPRVALARLAAQLWQEAAAVQAAANIALDDAHVSSTARSLEPLRARVRSIIDAGASTGAFRQDLTPDVVAVLVEESARSALRVVPEGARDAASLVRVVLSIAGLSWIEQGDLLRAHPEIVEGL